MQQTKAILLRAADILSVPNAWTQHEYARDDAGESILHASDTEAVCWCAAGAVLKAHHEATGQDLTDKDDVWPSALEALAKHLGYVPNVMANPTQTIAQLNDDETTTAEVMIAKIREAADVSAT